MSISIQFHTQKFLLHFSLMFFASSSSIHSVESIEQSPPQIQDILFLWMFNRELFSLILSAYEHLKTIVSSCFHEKNSRSEMKVLLIHISFTWNKLQRWKINIFFSSLLFLFDNARCTLVRFIYKIQPTHIQIKFMLSLNVFLLNVSSVGYMNEKAIVLHNALFKIHSKESKDK